MTSSIRCFPMPGRPAFSRYTASVGERPPTPGSAGTAGAPGGSRVSRIGRIGRDWARNVSSVAQRFDPADPGPAVLAFLTERHLATLTTLRPDGRAHVVPVGFTYEPEHQRARIITFASSVKARNVARQPGAAAVLCQLDGARWLSLEGAAVLHADTAANADAEARYALRYRPPAQREDRVTIQIQVTTILGSLGSAARGGPARR